MRRTLAALVLSCCLPAALAQAQVYKWTDATGVVHYAETPPAKGKYQTLATHGGVEPLSPPAAAAPASSAASGPAPLEDTPANRAKLCDDVKHNLGLLQGGGALSVKDAKGAVQPMSAEQRQRELAQAQQQFKDYCGK